jgi:hypothetical protein
MQDYFSHPTLTAMKRITAAILLLSLLATATYVATASPDNGNMINGRKDLMMHRKLMGAMAKKDEFKGSPCSWIKAAFGGKEDAACDIWCSWVKGYDGGYCRNTDDVCVCR